MNADQSVELLRTNPVFWSRLGFCYDPPFLDQNDKPLVFSQNFSREVGYHAAYAQAGVKLHTSILHTGWVGMGKYDYSLTDRVLDAVFGVDDSIYYIPRIKLNVPIDWCAENPTEVFVYDNGPRDAEGIKKLVGSLKQDILGYESEKGYYDANSKNDPAARPNVGGVIALQSFSSQKWQQDAGEALVRLIRHIENGPYADRILAYHITYGACGESMPWGRQDGKFGDYGISNQRAFWEWGLQRYGTPDRLRQVWGEGCCKTNAVPPADRRERSDRILRLGKEDTICVDYDRFTSEMNAGAIERFGRLVKEETGGKISGGTVTGGKAVGVFYGYYLHMARAAYAGHLAIDQLLRSPYIDFFAAPKSYYRSTPGEPGGEMCPAQSINRKKLWLDESDNRTHLCTALGEQHRAAQNFSETRTVLWREFAKNIAHGSGFWWMDLGGGWYDDPQIMDEIKRITKLNHLLQEKEHHSISEILIVTDEESEYYRSVNPKLHRQGLEESIREAHLCGAPVDLLRFADLTEIDLHPYRLVIFLSVVRPDERDWERIGIPENAAVLWCGCDGLPVPPICCRAKQAPPLSAAFVRQTAEQAGCHLYAPPGCTVYADNRILSVFSSHEAANGRLLLPHPAGLHELIREEHLEKAEIFPFSLDPKDAVFYQYV